MLRVMNCFLIFSSVCMWAGVNGNQLITYSHEEMQEHKRKYMDRMRSNPTNLRDASYQMNRALLSISADDADYIPKVPGAGEIFNDEVPYQLMHNGVKIVLNCYYDVQWITDVICGLKGHHEPQEEKCFYEVLKYMPENATMIELGSFWAYYSLWFASQVKNSKNYLIEPDPRRLEVGRKNFELNNKTGIFRRGFVGVMKDGEPDIQGADWISIDDFMEREGIEHVNILQADVQGAESEMLQTTVRHLDKIDYFFISTHNHQTDHPLCLNFFKKHGFIILAAHADVESCSGDGLIVAKRQGVAGPDLIEIRTYHR